MSTEDTDTVERTIRQARVQHVEFSSEERRGGK